MGFWKDLATFFSGKPVKLPPQYHTWVTTEWKPISYNSIPPTTRPAPKAPAPPVRSTCGFIPPNPNYAPCTLPPHTEGPCAHPFAKGRESAGIAELKEDNPTGGVLATPEQLEDFLTPRKAPRSALYHFVAARARCAILPQDEGLSFDIFVEATRRRDAIAKFNRNFPEFVFTDLSKAKP